MHRNKIEKLPFELDCMDQSNSYILKEDISYDSSQGLDLLFDVY